MVCEVCHHRDCAANARDRRASLKAFVFVTLTALLLGGLLYWDGWWAQ